MDILLDFFLKGSTENRDYRYSDSDLRTLIVFQVQVNVAIFVILELRKIKIENETGSNS